MIDRLIYFARETFLSLRRNLLMTIAGIMTVAVSLFLFGGVLLISSWVSNGTDRWKNGVEMEIFMRPDATQQQIDAVGKSLDAAPEVTSKNFLSKEDAYKEAQRIFRNEPELREELTPEILPTSYRIKLTDPALSTQIRNRFQTVAGVERVISADEEVKKVLAATKILRWGFIALASVLLASSLFLIVNTIRLATFARRREIEVMKLVGASNWFVRIPFMAEGLIQGLFGAAIAFGFVSVIKVLLTNFSKGTDTIFRDFYIADGDPFFVGMVVFGVGAAIGLVGSMIGLRRFLSV